MQQSQVFKHSWRIHACYTIFFYVWHDSFIPAPWLTECHHPLDFRKHSPLAACHALFLQVTCLTSTCDTPDSYTWLDLHVAWPTECHHLLVFGLQSLTRKSRKIPSHAPTHTQTWSYKHTHTHLHLLEGVHAAWPLAFQIKEQVLVDCPPPSWGSVGVGVRVGWGRWDLQMVWNQCIVVPRWLGLCGSGGGGRGGNGF